MNDKDARNNIIQTVVNLLAEGEDVGRITVRQVAERAGVSVGLINYHFNSKNELLGIAVATHMAKMATDFSPSEDDEVSDPVDKLKTMLKQLYGYGEQHEKAIKFTITQNLLQGGFHAPLYVMPALKEIFGTGKDEMHLRTIALQILLPIQVTSLNPEKFLLYSGINLHDEGQRNEYIDTLVENVLCLGKNKPVE
ncbi:MAG: TetR/AcrR family transcriptional regulator [Bacillota bacterium]|nr:TetR/AcrR family transcriptional regulator [Bacillota bacterium]MDW7676655.1 TetR/AcrR family transcriptional regulator [Bacillota bacterium]